MKKKKELRLQNMIMLDNLKIPKDSALSSVFRDKRLLILME